MQKSWRVTFGLLLEGGDLCPFHIFHQRGSKVVTMAINRVHAGIDVGTRRCHVGIWKNDSIDVLSIAIKHDRSGLDAYCKWLALFGDIKTSAQSTLSTAITDIVVALPANSDHAHRQPMIDAAKACGLNVQECIDESVATALAYGIAGCRGEHLPSTYKSQITFRHVASPLISNHLFYLFFESYLFTDTYIPHSFSILCLPH